MSATASSLPHQQTLPSEPFGQAGVRQYIGRILAWIMFTVALAAAAMAQRSGGLQEGNGYFDTLQWRRSGQGFGVVSISGQLIVFGGSTLNPNNNSGWSQGGGYVRDPQMFGRRRWAMDGAPLVAWQTDLGRLIGLEYQDHAPAGEFSQGFLFRFKWLTLAALFMIQPLVYVLVRLRRHRAEARDDA